jgi:hypothetical protein
MADVFRVPMEVTYALQGGEPALMAYRRWRNIFRDDLAATASPETPLRRLRMGRRTSKRPCLKASRRCSRCLRTS